MTNLFKKTLVAVAVATAAMTVNAAEITYTPVGVSKEGVVGVNTFDLGQSLTIELGAEYTVGDIIRLSVNGDALDKDAFPNSITVPAVLVAGVAGVDGEWTKKITLGKLSSTAAGATYRVTAVELHNAAGPDVNLDTTIGAVITFANGDIAMRSNQTAAAGIVILQYKAETQTGVALDSIESVELTVAGNEFTAGVTTALDGTIRIQDARRRFTSLNAKDQFAVASTEAVSIKRNAADLVPAPILAATDASETGITVELKGNFGWVPDVTKPTNYVTAAGCSIAPANDGSVTATKVTATAATVGTCTLDFDLAGGLGNFAPAAIEPQDGANAFTVTYTVAYNDAGANERTKVLLQDAYAGEWILNAFSTTIGYMPYGEGTSQIVYLANQSGTAGKIYADAWTQNGTKVLSNVELATSTPFGQTQLSTPLKTALDAAGVTSDRVRIRILAEVPTGNARVFSAYNVSGDRLATGNF